MLIRREEKDEIIWGIWHIEESTDYLLSQLLVKDFAHIISSEKRLKEQTAVRILLKALIGEEKVIGYSSNGKPYLTDNSYAISISHTKGYAAVILSKNKRVGIDIEYMSEKVKRVRDKFISENEYIDPDNETVHLLLHWSAKETIYKALGLMGVDFKEDLFIERFAPYTSGYFNAKERFSDEEHDFKIQYFVEKDYVLTLTY
ncbi:4'-phosphopantetheinyl transferase superfamily protein [Dysgonomonas sp. OttesenSCG-928-M03]|nr:4'-phosphopantetheinyl transferase superfamily protein [Dysgonomonas sp. OttesenSCG-928-M03]